MNDNNSNNSDMTVKEESLNKDFIVKRKGREESSEDKVQPKNEKLTSWCTIVVITTKHFVVFHGAS